MKTQPNPKKSGGTFNRLVTVAKNLMRDPEGGGYYAVKKVSKKRHVHKLETTDRKVAERKLAEWLSALIEADPGAKDLTLAGLFARARAAFPGGPSTVRTRECAYRLFERTFTRGMALPLTKVRASEIAEWFKRECGHMRHHAFNGYRRELARVFGLALTDRAVPAPGFFSKELVPRKKKQSIIRHIPTAAQFAQIVASIRECGEKNFKARHSADMIEFCGLAGVGQAEAKALRWEHIAFATGEVFFVRQKTQKEFTQPLFTPVRQLLEGMRAKARGAVPAGRVFAVDNAHAALENACARLGLPHITPRNLRSMRITAWRDAGVSSKQAGEWQGHSDDGKLIREIYTVVERADKIAYRAAQIALVEGGKVVQFPAAA